MIIRRSDLSEQTRTKWVWAWKCPYCGHYNEEDHVDIEDGEDLLQCLGCQAILTIED